MPSDETRDEMMAALEDRPDGEAGAPVGPQELPDELIDELLAGARTPEEVTGPDGLLQHLTKRLVERAMDAELTEHLGYERGGAPPGGAGNTRKWHVAEDGAHRARLGSDRAAT
jgi:hypothetical protein